MIDGVDVGNSGLAGNEESTEGIEAQNKGGQSDQPAQNMGGSSATKSLASGVGDILAGLRKLTLPPQNVSLSELL
jgi:hypothetical protein